MQNDTAGHQKTDGVGGVDIEVVQQREDIMGVGQIAE